MISSWVVSSDPQLYNCVDSFKENDYVDWITPRNFQDHDVVYIYEKKSTGRGAIVYKTEAKNITLDDDDMSADLVYWKGQSYPPDSSAPRCSRLMLIAEKNDDRLSLGSLKSRKFWPPQRGTLSLDNKPELLSYVEECFKQ